MIYLLVIKKNKKNPIQNRFALEKSMCSNCAFSPIIINVFTSFFIPIIGSFLVVNLFCPLHVCLQITELLDDERCEAECEELPQDGEEGPASLDSPQHTQTDDSPSSRWDITTVPYIIIQIIFNPGMGLKGGMTCDKRSQTGFKNSDIPVTWYLPVHQANLWFGRFLSAALLSLILYGVSWT